MIGAGTSGSEIATWLAEVGGGDVLVSVRTVPVLLPRQKLGVPMSLLGLFADRAPPTIVDRVGAAVQQAAFRGVDLGGDGARHRLSERRFRRYAPTIDSGFGAAIRKGSVEIVPAVVEFGQHEVELADGRILTPDTVIAATGYRPELGDLVGHLGVLDATGRPLPAPDLGRVAPGLHFVGLRPRLGPLLPAGRREATRVADAVAGRRS